MSNTACRTECTAGVFIRRKDRSFRLAHSIKRREHSDHLHNTSYSFACCAKTALCRKHGRAPLPKNAKPTRMRDDRSCASRNACVRLDQNNANPKFAFNRSSKPRMFVGPSTLRTHTHTQHAMYCRRFFLRQSHELYTHKRYYKTHVSVHRLDQWSSTFSDSQPT